MTVKFLSRTARLLGFIVSPLLTAPAAAGDFARGAVLLRDAPAALHAAALARGGADGAYDQRRRGA